MTIKRVRPEGELRQWQRNTAESVNQALNRMAFAADLTTLDGQAVKKDGLDIYAGDTAGGSYDQTKMQVLMDAVAAISDRLKG